MVGFGPGTESDLMFLDEPAGLADGADEDRPWKLLIVDDEPDVHRTVALHLGGFRFRNRPLLLLTAAPIEDARTLLAAEPDLALVLLDLGMDQPDAGLLMIDYIRGDLANRRIRIVVVTAQPGLVADERLVIDYDINDYRTKTDLTGPKLTTIVVTALRAYADIVELERSRHQTVVAEEATKAKSLFLATMSHEIRTPVNGMIGLLDLLDQTGVDDDQRELIGLCQDSAAALLTLIDDLLDFSKIEAGKLVVEPTPTAVDALVWDVADLLSGRAWQRGLDLAVRILTPLPPTIQIDGVRLRQILLNLVGNAIKFTESGHVRIDLELSPLEPGRQVLRIAVNDSGIGIEPEQQQRLFQAFEQADPSTSRRFGGTGLGLAICRRLTELMGGRIGVESIPHFGSTFWVEFDLAQGPTVDRSPDLGGLLILVATASRTLAQSLAPSLQRAGAAILLCDTRDSVLSAIVQGVGDRPISLVLADEDLEGTSILPLLHSLTDLREAPPVVLMIRRDHASLMRRARSLGVGAILPKVVRSTALLETIATATGRAIPTPIDGESGPGRRPLPRPQFPDKRVLVAEDTRSSQIVIGRMLGNHGITPTQVESGAEALRLLETQGFDLLISDCHMPGLDGWALARRIREREAGSGRRLPILALSANQMPDEIERCRAAGMDDFLAKPLDAASLQAALSRWLTGSGGPPTPLPPPPPSNEAAAILDLDLLIEVFGGLNAEVRELVTTFIAEAAGLIADLSAPGALDVRGNAIRALHRLSGGARSLGAGELIREAITGERALMSDDLATTAAAIARLPAAFERLKSVVERLDWAPDARPEAGPG